MSRNILPHYTDGLDYEAMQQLINTAELSEVTNTGIEHLQTLGSLVVDLAELYSGSALEMTEDNDSQSRAFIAGSGLAVGAIMLSSPKEAERYTRGIFLFDKDMDACAEAIARRRELQLKAVSVEEMIEAQQELISRAGHNALFSFERRVDIMYRYLGQLLLHMCKRRMFKNNVVDYMESAKVGFGLSFHAIDLAAKQEMADEVATTIENPRDFERLLTQLANPQT